MSNFNERVNLLTELLNEGHITNDEFAELVGSLRGGSLNDVDEHEGHSTSEYEEEINNPNKLQDYEDFLNGKCGPEAYHRINGGSAFIEDELFDPNFSDVALDKRVGIHGNAIELDEFGLAKYPLHNNTMNAGSSTAMGLYKQDIHSGSVLRGCKLIVNTAGKVVCTEPFHSHEHNNPWSFS